MIFEKNISQQANEWIIRVQENIDNRSINNKFLIVQGYFPPKSYFIFSSRSCQFLELKAKYEGQSAWPKHYAFLGQTPQNV